MRQEPAYRLVLKAEKAAKSNRPALPGAQKKSLFRISEQALTVK